MSLNRWTRKLHRWGAVLIAIPLVLVIVSGLLLQVKKQMTWVQPATMKGTAAEPQVAWDVILKQAQAVPEAEVKEWDDIDRMDIRIKDKIVKIQCKNRWELQLDLADGRLLSSTYRRSDFIESLHDGSWFGDNAKLWVFLPNGLILLGLWLTGLYLWYLPIGVRRRKKQKRKGEKSA